MLNGYKKSQKNVRRQRIVYMVERNRIIALEVEETVERNNRNWEEIGGYR